MTQLGRHCGGPAAGVLLQLCRPGGGELQVECSGKGGDISAVEHQVFPADGAAGAQLLPGPGQDGKVAGDQDDVQPACGALGEGVEKRDGPRSLLGGDVVQNQIKRRGAAEGAETGGRLDVAGRKQGQIQGGVQRGQLPGQPEKAVLSAVRKGGVPTYGLGREGAQGVSDCGGLTESRGGFDQSERSGQQLLQPLG